MATWGDGMTQLRGAQMKKYPQFFLLIVLILFWLFISAEKGIYGNMMHIICSLSKQ
jgi:hypothetical protein